MKAKALEEFKKIVEALLHPQTGCPWDLEQTHQSLTPFLLEEAYEFIDAVERNDITDMEEELGDVLFQVFLHAQIAENNTHFNLEGVTQHISEKIKRRHPHVFSSEQKKLSKEEVAKQWQVIKAKEKAKKQTSLLPSSLLHAPALSSSANIGKRTQALKFDWDSPMQVWEKVKEEMSEFEEEMKNGEIKKIEEEWGDLVFTLAQMARHLSFDPEKALKKTNTKFLRRFMQMENLIEKNQLKFDEISMNEKEKFWIQAKNAEKKL